MSRSLEVRSEPHRWQRVASRVIDTLDRWSDRCAGHHQQRREHPRRALRSLVTVYVAECEGFAGECAESISFQAWSRNVSRAGLSFIYPKHISVERFIVGMSSPKSGPIFFHCQVVRSRQIHEGYWEYGVQFVERAVM